MGPIARGLVRWRWVVVVAWVVIGVVAAIRAPHTPEVLNIRGGSSRPNESAAATRALTSRFSRPISEFFVVTVKGPEPFDSGAAQRVLDTLIGRVASQSYVRSIASYSSTHDSAFISRDHRATFFVVSLEVADGDSAGRLVVPFRTLVRRTLEGLADGHAYRALVTGRSPLDLDVRTVSAEDSRRSEARLLPLTMVVLVLAFGALVAAALPLVVGFLAIAVSLTIVGVVARYTPMSIFVLNMTTMIGLGVGID